MKPARKRDEEMIGKYAVSDLQAFVNWVDNRREAGVSATALKGDAQATVDAVRAETAADQAELARLQSHRPPLARLADKLGKNGDVFAPNEVAAREEVAGDLQVQQRADTLLQVIEQAAQVEAATPTFSRKVRRGEVRDGQLTKEGVDAFGSEATQRLGTRAVLVTDDGKDSLVASRLGGRLFGRNMYTQSYTWVRDGSAGSNDLWVALNPMSPGQPTAGVGDYIVDTMRSGNAGAFEITRLVQQEGRLLANIRFSGYLAGSYDELSPRLTRAEMFELERFR